MNNQKITYIYLSDLFEKEDSFIENTFRKFSALFDGVFYKPHIFNSENKPDAMNLAKERVLSFFDLTLEKDNTIYILTNGFSHTLIPKLFFENKKYFFVFLNPIINESIFKKRIYHNTKNKIAYYNGVIDYIIPHNFLKDLEKEIQSKNLPLEKISIICDRETEDEYFTLKNYTISEFKENEDTYAKELLKILTIINKKIHEN